MDHRWSGGYYLLWLGIGEPDHEAIRRALDAMWGHPALQGCYEDAGRSFAEQPRLDALDPRFSLEDSRYGLGTLNNGTRVRVRSQLQRIDGEADALWLGVPMASLSSAYAVGGYPFDSPEDLGWRDEVDIWLADVARHVHRVLPITLGLTGWEVDDLDLSARDVRANGVPDERWATYLVPSEVGLSVFPCNTGYPTSFPKDGAP